MKLYRAIYPHEYEKLSKGEDVVYEGFTPQLVYGDIHHDYTDDGVSFNTFSKDEQGIYWYAQSKKFDKPVFPMSTAYGFYDDYHASHMVEWEVSEHELKKMGAHFGAGAYDITMPEVTVPRYGPKDNIKITPIDEADRYFATMFGYHGKEDLGPESPDGSRSVKMHAFNEHDLFDCYDTFEDRPLPEEKFDVMKAVREIKAEEEAEKKKAAQKASKSSAPAAKGGSRSIKSQFESILDTIKNNKKTAALGIAGLGVAAIVASDIANQKGANTTQALFKGKNN